MEEPGGGSKIKTTGNLRLWGVLIENAREETVQQFNITISKKLFRHLGKIFPKEMSWEEIIRELLDRADLPAPPLTLNQIRATCQHLKTEVKSGLYPNPEELWKWCPRCQMLVEKIA